MTLPVNDKSAIQATLLGLSGTWVQTRLEENGHAVASDEYGVQPRLTIDACSFHVHDAHHNLVLAGHFTIDPSKDPKQIDWTDTLGPDAGKTFQAIFTLDCDTFVFSAADEYCPRPTSFATQRGHTLRAFERIENQRIEDSSASKT